MNDQFSYVYNRVLDVTAVGSIMVKPFCIYIITTKTPKYMQSVSYFILNELIWNFMGNLLFTLGHPFPMMPALCFRMDGLAGNWLKTENQRSVFFIGIVLTSFNCSLAFATTFLFRYLTLHYGAFSRFHKTWGFLYCITCHSTMSLLAAFLFHLWQIPIWLYPKQDLPKDIHNLFCFHPEGAEITIIGCYLVACFGGGTLFLGLFAGLSVRELRMKKDSMEKKTLHLQKEIMKNLLIISGVAVFLGCVPLVVMIFCVYNGRFPFAREITAIGMLITLNFGTIYALLILYRFRCYKKAVVDMIMRLL
uniref:G_PROTEIN_RECEP_F1_2 domain-containing protein n=1 Tax=Steinernema glaseri TaxID=37863 RepID=A0A1I7ZXQ9_9BILA